MKLTKYIFVVCALLTLFACSGLLKNSKKITEPVVKITTDYGDMWIELSDSTPLHKANFLKLAKEGFYDSTLFHRVINKFMIQGGDPSSKNAQASKQLGDGGPGYTVPAEINPVLIHKKGALSAARLGDGQNPKKASSGSQFYLVQGKVFSIKDIQNFENHMKRNDPDFKLTAEQITAYTTVGGTPFLDGNYTVFGQVIKGIEVIDKIASVKTTGRSKGDRPVENVIMKVEVIQLTKKLKLKLLTVEEDKK